VILGKPPYAFGDAFPGWTFLFAPLREIITAVLLTHLIVRLRVNNWQNALGLGFVLWFSFYFVQLTVLSCGITCHGNLALSIPVTGS
jgi:hypothetical protein